MKGQEDVIIIGGSFAGLAAAMYLARARRDVLVIDSGEPRNRFSAHSHGVFALDGQPGSELLATAKSQLLRYPTARLVSKKASRASKKEGFSKLKQKETKNTSSPVA